MVHVIARAEIKPGCMEKFLAVLNGNVPTVRAEAGCIRYEVCRPVGAAADDPFVFIVETWESEAALKAHLDSAHMAAYRAAIKDLRCGSEVKVLTPIG